MWYTGQKVVCVNANNVTEDGIIKDNIYIIEQFVSNSNGEGFFLDGVNVLDHNNLRIGYRTRRFVPLDILNTELNIEELLSNKV